jgi:hypothetical protein
VRRDILRYKSYFDQGYFQEYFKVPDDSQCVWKKLKQIYNFLQSPSLPLLLRVKPLKMDSSSRQTKRDSAKKHSGYSVYSSKHLRIQENIRTSSKGMTTNSKKNK